MDFIEIETELPGGTKTVIVITNDDDSTKSFPADPANPEYAAFLKALDDNSEAE
jgi:hypothetical protein